MKYIYLKPQDRDFAIEDRLIPVRSELHIEKHDGVAYLAMGNKLLIDLDAHNQTALIPFLAEAFQRNDVVTIQLTGLPVSKPDPREKEEE